MRKRGAEGRHGGRDPLGDDRGTDHRWDDEEMVADADAAVGAAVPAERRTLH
jgi:hypothetical protein